MTPLGLRFNMASCSHSLVLTSKETNDKRWNGEKRRWYIHFHHTWRSGGDRRAGKDSEENKDAYTRKFSGYREEEGIHEDKNESLGEGGGEHHRKNCGK